MEECSATQDEFISRNRSYRDLQTSWLDFCGNLATPLFHCESPWLRHESLPRAGKKKIRAASACRFASAPRIWNQAFTVSMFPFFPLPPLLPCRCRALHMDSRHYTTLSVKVKKKKIHGVTGCHENTGKLFYDFRSLVNIA